MGTSSSSAGPGSGVPFDPPWLDDIPSPEFPNIEPEPDYQSPETPAPDDKELSPNARFRGARINMNQYVSSGNRGKLNRALGHYSQNGMGGAKFASQRMRTSSKTAAGLYGLLQAASSGDSQSVRTWVESLSTRNADAREIASEIVTLITPKGGSLDESSAQNSITLALEDLLTEDPDVDLLNLNEGSIWSLVGSFLGYELFNRIYMDIGHGFETSSLPPQEIEFRKDEMRDYIISDINASIERIRQAGKGYSDNQMEKVFQEVLQRTLEIYEGELW